MNSQRQWQFVGSIPENYERYLVPSVFSPWAEDLVEMAALRPGERVARDVPSTHTGGRLVLSVWGPIQRSPGFAVLAEALTQHIGPDAGALMTAGPFSLSDADELRAMVAEATFKDITIRPEVKTLRFLSPDEFVLHYAAGSALASGVAHAHDDAVAALLAGVATKLQSAIDDQGLGFPIEANLVITHK